MYDYIESVNSLKKRHLLPRCPTDRANDEVLHPAIDTTNLVQSEEALPLIKTKKNLTLVIPTAIIFWNTFCVPEIMLILPSIHCFIALFPCCLRNPSGHLPFSSHISSLDSGHRRRSRCWKWWPSGLPIRRWFTLSFPALCTHWNTEICCIASFNLISIDIRILVLWVNCNYNGENLIKQSWKHGYAETVAPKLTLTFSLGQTNIDVENPWKPTICRSFSQGNHRFFYIIRIIEF